MLYDGTYACGHKGEVDVCGSHKDRQWRIDREFSGLCPECFKKAKQEKMQKEREEAAKKSAEMELPRLMGSEKQVAWANVIRMEVIEEYEECLASYNERKKERKEKGMPDEEYMYRHLQITEEDFISSFNYALKSLVDVNFWIDNRAKVDILLRTVRAGKEAMKKADIPEEIKNEIEKEKIRNTVCPKNKRKEGVVILEKSGDPENLYARYIKDEKFIEIVKEVGFQWDRYRHIWGKEITEYTGSVEERAAELGIKLLSAGFTVEFPNTEAKEAALSGNFKPECKRWIKKQKNTGKLAIVWEGRNDFIYSSSKKLPGAKWADGYMSVPTEFYREVQDFAKTLGFSVSKSAQEAIDEYMKKESDFECTEVNAPKPEISDKEKVARLLKASGTVIEDLLDD